MNYSVLDKGFNRLPFCVPHEAILQCKSILTILKYWYEQHQSCLFIWLSFTVEKKKKSIHYI